MHFLLSGDGGAAYEAALAGDELGGVEVEGEALGLLGGGLLFHCFFALKVSNFLLTLQS